jgi:hypothetical protein
MKSVENGNEIVWILLRSRRNFPFKFFLLNCFSRCRLPSNATECMVANSVTGAQNDSLSESSTSTMWGRYKWRQLHSLPCYIEQHLYSSLTSEQKPENFSLKNEILLRQFAAKVSQTLANLFNIFKMPSGDTNRWKLCLSYICWISWLTWDCPLFPDQPILVLRSPSVLNVKSFDHGERVVPWHKIAKFKIE